MTEEPQRPAVLELYDCEELWPKPIEEPSFPVVLASGKHLLVAHFRDTLAILNTPLLREQMVELPAVALGALFGSDDFGTDNESSVLQLLATWMKENYEKTTAEVRQRLCRTVRLTHLSRPYLGMVLPALAADHEKDPKEPVGWFAVGAMGAALVASFVSASKNERNAMLLAPSGAELLMASPRAQCIPAEGGLSYSWHITWEQLQVAGGGLPTNILNRITGTFDQCLEHLLSAWGFEWKVQLNIKSGRSTAGLFLNCYLPAAVAPPGSRLSREPSLTRTTFVPISARLTVHRRLGGAQKNVQGTLSSSQDFVAVGTGLGWAEVLPLREPLPLPLQPPGSAGANGVTAIAAAADPLAAWADYLIDGKISGTLTLLPPNV